MIAHTHLYPTPAAPQCRTGEVPVGVSAAAPAASTVEDLAVEDDLVTAPVLPHRDSLRAVCREDPSRRECDPILNAAAELALLHRRRVQAPAEVLAVIDADRDQWIAIIDNWGWMVLPEPASQARVHTHTLGEVIDRFAHASAVTAIMACCGGPDPGSSDAHTILDDLADAYADLADELLRGTRRLPHTAVLPSPAPVRVSDPSIAPCRSTRPVAGRPHHHDHPLTAQQDALPNSIEDYGHEPAHTP